VVPGNAKDCRTFIFREEQSKKKSLFLNRFILEDEGTIIL
jgi:hypothetical protein